MKTTILTCLCSFALALYAFGQNPTLGLPTSPQPTAPVASSSPATSVSAAAAVSATPDDEEAIEHAVARKLKRHFGVDIDLDSGRTKVSRDRGDDHDFDDNALMAIPIVGIIFTTLFGAPVLVVAAIMFFSYLKARSLHRTVRTMVEKGQEVPAALFASPPVVRARSDMRRGVVLVMVGVGLMIFFAAVNDWEGGAWAIGIIPFLIGAGYLAVWKLEGPKDKVPPLP